MSRELLEKLAERRKLLNRSPITTWLTGKTMEKAMALAETVMGKSRISKGMLKDPQFSIWKFGEEGIMAECMSDDSMESLQIAIPSCMEKSALNEADVVWEKGVKKIPFVKQLKKTGTQVALLHSDVKYKLKEFRNEQLEFTFKQPLPTEVSEMEIHGVNGNTSAGVFDLKHKFYDVNRGTWVQVPTLKSLKIGNFGDVRGIIEISKLKKAVIAMSKVDKIIEVFRIHSYLDETSAGTSEDQLTGFVTKLGNDEVIGSMAIPVDYKSRGYQNKGGMTGLPFDRLLNLLKVTTGEAVIEFGEDMPVRIIGVIKTPEPIYYEYVLAHRVERK